jgi:DNA-binding transcriptional regulator/RsmH inhibitor MraZ
VVLAGVGNRIEIWSAIEYQKILTPMSERSSLQEIARGLFDKKGPNAVNE